MDVKTLVDAVVLGVVEGLTEFIPVSSTGHLLLLGHFLGFKSTGRAFEVLIQLGAILALLTVYFGRLWSVVLALPVSRRARRFALGVLLAFLPAAFIGVLAHDIIKRVLFESPALICVTLFIGGLVLLVMDRLPLKPRYGSAYDFPLWVALVIGCFQTLALVPGVSRSGSTIVGALLLRTDKRSAAEFSFFLAMPTMAGAFAFDLYKNRDALSWNDALVVAVGFVAAFLAAIIVVRRLLDFISRHGFAPFAYWRIAVGALGLIALWATGDIARNGFIGGAPVEGAQSDAPRTVVTKTIRVTAPVSDFPLRSDTANPSNPDSGIPPVVPAPADAVPGQAAPANREPPAETSPDSPSSPPPAAPTGQQAPAASGGALPPGTQAPGAQPGAGSGSSFEDSFSIFNQPKKK